ncbi:MAG: SDR family NAD(P)-dependent oxidoreductase [Bacteroidetes bacterium]|nr:SDR family NAD(P)-dependent oxidoreductase [Bacteroidota bacterium]
MNTLMINKIIPAIRMIASREKVLTIRLNDSERFSKLNTEDSVRALPFVKANSGIIVITEKTEPEDIIAEIEIKISAWYTAHTSHPDFILLEKLGLIALASNASELDSLLGLPVGETKIVSGRVQDKIIIVTGGAQGFGGGIAELLYAYGANVVIADLNEEAGKGMANILNTNKQANQAFFVKVNVSDPTSVEEMITNTVKQFGGLDVIISNAGILRAGGLDEMTPESFALMTDVNYKGYFFCAKYASSVMKVQSNFRKDYFMDIIQINSKSGLKGSNRNFAYAGGKFGGIGLTQSFAMELMPNRIKVNSICPGNFYEGPLWSDPQKGLFVQYLNAGKVPGAKTLNDVKAFYDAQVPAGRGCRVLDVVRAILYAIEQEYETGQAIPVTGGQNMLN